MIYILLPLIIHLLTLSGMMSNFLNFYEFCLGKDVVLLGDFNLSTFQWERNLASFGLSFMDCQFFDCFNILGFTQWVTEATFLPSGSTLDLILTSESDSG